MYVWRTIRSDLFPQLKALPLPLGHSPVWAGHYPLSPVVSPLLCRALFLQKLGLEFVPFCVACHPNHGDADDQSSSTSLFIGFSVSANCGVLFFGPLFLPPVTLFPVWQRSIVFPITSLRSTSLSSFRGQVPSPSSLSRCSNLLKFRIFRSLCRHLRFFANPPTSPITNYPFWQVHLHRPSRVDFGLMSN